MKEKEQVIIKTVGIHCKMGSERCAECKEAASHLRFALYKIEECKRPKYVQHPHYSRILNGQLIGLCDSNLVKEFKNKEEAERYAKENSLDIIE